MTFTPVVTINKNQNGTWDCFVQSYSTRTPIQTCTTKDAATSTATAYAKYNGLSYIAPGSSFLYIAQDKERKFVIIEAKHSQPAEIKVIRYTTFQQALMIADILASVGGKKLIPHFVLPKSATASK